MKLEVGMYARTGGGTIRKIDRYEKANKDCTNPYVIGYEGIQHCILYSEEEINNIKASHKLIDLIEEGDYVNGEKVISINTYIDNRPSEKIKIVTDHYCILEDEFEDDNSLIKSIVTREQFESMQYKVSEVE